MKGRRLPRDLYEEVLKLTTEIAQPHAVVESGVDPATASRALSRLVQLFEQRQSSGEGDPFLTETLADFTEDNIEAVRLYRLALEQCAIFPGEPTRTKRQGLVDRLLQLGLTQEAHEELAAARREAFAAGDIDAVKELNDVERAAAV